MKTLFSLDYSCFFSTFFSTFLFFLTAEITNGMPLFPGESDIDQLFHIVRCFGTLTDRQMELFRTNPLFGKFHMFS